MPKNKKSKLEKELEAFLKSKRLYARFCRTLKADRNIPFKELCALLKKNNWELDAISAAFYWPLREVNFWASLQRDWKRFLYEKAKS